jgi:hypothetical protein
VVWRIAEQSARVVVEARQVVFLEHDASSLRFGDRLLDVVD